MPYPESPHPYPPNYDNTEVYIHPVPAPPGMTHLAVTFNTLTATEAGFDFIRIYDGAGALLGTYSGTQLQSTVIYVPGDTVRIRLTSDINIQDYGYKVVDVHWCRFNPAVVPDVSLWVSEFQQSDRGPHQFGSTLYFVCQWILGPVMRVVVQKSTDNGATWAEVAAAGSPHTNDQNHGVVRSGDVLYIIHSTTAAGQPLAIAVFDMATDSWLPTIVGGPDTYVFPGGVFRLATAFGIAHRSDGSFVVTLTDHTFVDPAEDASYLTVSAAGVWGPVTHIGGVLIPGDSEVDLCWLGANDRVHFACTPHTFNPAGAYPVTLATLTMAGVLDTWSPPGVSCGNYWNFRMLGVPGRYWGSGTDQWFALPFAKEAAANTVPAVLRAISVDQIRTVYVDTLVDIPPGAASNRSTPALGIPGSSNLPVLFVEEFGAFRPWTGTWTAAPGTLPAFFLTWGDFDKKIHLVTYSGTGQETYNNNAGWTSVDLPSGSEIFRDVGGNDVAGLWTPRVLGAPPPPPSGGVGGGAGGGGGRPAMMLASACGRPPGLYDACLLDLYHKLQTAFSRLACDTNPPAWIEMPEQGRRFQAANAIPKPALIDTDTLVLTMRVPFGYDGVITSIYHYFVPTFLNASGQLTWRLMLDNRWVADYDAVLIAMGVPGNPMALGGGGVRIQSGQTLRYFVSMNAAGMGALNPAGSVVCGLFGWFYPRQTSLMTTPLLPSGVGVGVRDAQGRYRGGDCRGYGEFGRSQCVRW